MSLPKENTHTMRRFFIGHFSASNEGRDGTAIECGADHDKVMVGSKRGGRK